MDINGRTPARTAASAPLDFIVMVNLEFVDQVLRQGVLSPVLDNLLCNQLGTPTRQLKCSTLVWWLRP